MFNLSNLWTRFKRGGGGAPYRESQYSTPRRGASAFPYEGATSGRRLGSWATTRDAVNAVWYQ